MPGPCEQALQGRSGAAVLDTRGSDRDDRKNGRHGESVNSSLCAWTLSDAPASLRLTG